MISGKVSFHPVLSAWDAGSSVSAYEASWEGTGSQTIGEHLVVGERVVFSESILYPKHTFLKSFKFQ